MGQMTEIAVAFRKVRFPDETVCHVLEHAASVRIPRQTGPNAQSLDNGRG